MRRRRDLQVDVLTDAERATIGGLWERCRHGREPDARRQLADHLFELAAANRHASWSDHCVILGYMARLEAWDQAEPRMLGLLTGAVVE